MMQAIISQIVSFQEWLVAVKVVQALGIFSCV